RSTGVIQDCGSERQDSCGSSKDGDYRYVDPKETLTQTPCEIFYLKQSHHWNGQSQREKEEFMCIVLLDLGEHQG
ncbi:hypothetical protein S83_035949, partial [Arachis hypogaea]